MSSGRSTPKRHPCAVVRRWRLSTIGRGALLDITLYKVCFEGPFGGHLLMVLCEDCLKEKPCSASPSRPSQMDHGPQTCYAQLDMLASEYITAWWNEHWELVHRVGSCHQKHQLARTAFVSTKPKALFCTPTPSRRQ